MKLFKPLAFFVVIILTITMALFFIPLFKSITPEPINSGIKGIILLGPICPVETFPPNPDCADKPFQARVVIKNSSGIIVGEFVSKDDGTFEVPLAPGTYLLEPQSPNILPRGEPQTVTVQEGKFTEITIYYDTGIR